jgi:hypothetical protein
MGTSISQPSLRNTNWKPVHACYTNKNIPIERIVNEIWRASENDAIPISSSIKSETIYSCYEAVGTSKNPKEAMQKFNSEILKNKQNSIIAEFAKRAIPIAFQFSNPSQHWAANFFSEVTNYFMSRDTSGFVGEKYRNKTVKELIVFKTTIGKKVAEIVTPEAKKIKSKSSWDSFVEKSISNLRSIK